MVCSIKFTLNVDFLGYQISFIINLQLRRFNKCNDKGKPSES